MIDDKQNDINTVIKRFNKILDNGLTFNQIKDRILFCWHNHIKTFPWEMYKEQNDIYNLNLLKSNKTYYHKNLLIKNKIGIVNHNIDTGELTNSPTKFFLEPRASYTLNEFVDYFYEQTNIDKIQNNRKRVSNFFLALLNTYDIDMLLFMTEACIRYTEEEKEIQLNGFNDYQPYAVRYLKEMKDNRFKSIGVNYVIRNRELLFN